MTNIDPPESVPEGHDTKFRGLYGKCIQKKLAGFPEESKREDLRKEIDTQRQHRKLISYAIFPFAEGAPAGYKFIATEPLEELGVQNVDFLLYDMDGHVILGEAKSSIPSNAKRVVNELSERKKQAYKNKDYLEEEYLGDEITHIEFVLATYVQHGDRIAREIAAEGEDVITWVIDPYSDTLWVNQARPKKFPDNLSSEEPDKMLTELDRRLTHSVQDLNSKLDRITTSFGQTDILPTSIIVDQLRIVVQARQVKGRHPCVNRDDIIEYVNESILNYREERIEEIADNLIEGGKRINFLSGWDDDRAEYKIVSNYTARDDLEKVLEKKWIDWKIKILKDELRKECKEKAINEIGKQTKLSEFRNEGKT